MWLLFSNIRHLWCLISVSLITKKNIQIKFFNSQNKRNLLMIPRVIITISDANLLHNYKNLSKPLPIHEGFHFSKSFLCFMFNLKTIHALSRDKSKKKETSLFYWLHSFFSCVNVPRYIFH